MSYNYNRRKPWSIKPFERIVNLKLLWNISNKIIRYFGGWVAPKIYFLGYSGCIVVKKGQTSIRIAGISGIFSIPSFNNSKFYWYNNNNINNNNYYKKYN